MNYLGDFPVNGSVKFFWNTNGADGASITRSTDGTLKIYKDGSVTERSSLNGVTQTEDFDAATGVHYVAIDLSDNTDAGFYAAGSEYAVVMTGCVIDTKTVNAAIGEFSIERSGGALALLKHASYGLAMLVRSTTPANTLDVSATGEAGLDFNNVKNATGATTLTNITVPVVTSLTDKAAFTISGTKQTLDALQDLSQAGAQAGAAAALNGYDPPTKAELDAAASPLALEATLTAIKGAGWSTQTLVAVSALVDDLEGRLTATRAGYLDELGAANIPADIDSLLTRLTALRAGYLDNLSSGAAALEAQVQTHAAAALAAYDPPTRAEATADKAEIEAMAEKIRKALTNRLVVVPASGAYTIYADDGVTPLLTGTISGTGRSAPTWL